MNKKLFLSPPHMGGNELKYVQEVFESNYIAPLGAFVDRFEQAVCDYTQAKYALAVSSGTAAIHLALKVLGIKEGDLVLASTFTFIGSVVPILYEKAKPVFIDSEEESWNLDPALLENFLKNTTDMPKALILTHLYGQVAQIEMISDLCKQYGVYLIEDAAESLGATFNGKHSGTFGDFGIYSFNGNKILTTSGGGMLVSSNKEWIDKAKFYATQARENEIHYEHNEFGFNYRMSNVLAAIGVGQMEVLSQRVAKKREIFSFYENAFTGMDVRLMPELKGAVGNRWLTTILFEKKVDIKKIMQTLEYENIESRPLWKPMHMQPLFEKQMSVLNGVSEKLFSKGLCLPSGTAMSEADTARVIATIKETM